MLQPAQGVIFAGAAADAGRRGGEVQRSGGWIRRKGLLPLRVVIGQHRGVRAGDAADVAVTHYRAQQRVEIRHRRRITGGSGALPMISGQTALGARHWNGRDVCGFPRLFVVNRIIDFLDSTAFIVLIAGGVTGLIRDRADLTEVVDGQRLVSTVRIADRLRDASLVVAQRGGVVVAIAGAAALDPGTGPAGISAVTSKGEATRSSTSTTPTGPLAPIPGRCCGSIISAASVGRS